MKTLLFFVLIITAGVASAQMDKKTWKQIPAGVTTIEVSNNKTAAENFAAISELLLDNNFEIERRDAELGTINTNWQPMPRTGSYKLQIRCKDKLVIFTGQFTFGVSIEVYGTRSENNPQQIEKKGALMSAYGESFEGMYNVAAKYGEVSYR